MPAGFTKRIWLNWFGVRPDWLDPNFNCSAPPPERFPFQLDTTSVAAPAQVWLLLFAKLKRLTVPTRSMVTSFARIKRPSCSTALLIWRVRDTRQVPELVIRRVPPELPMTQSPSTLILLAMSVPPTNPNTL